MSIKLMSIAWQLPLPHTEKIVLLALADNANDQGICWPSLSSICEKASLSERAVQGCIRELESCCCLSVERRPGKGNVFTVHPHRFAPPHSLRGSTPAPDAPLPPQDMRGTPAPDAPLPPQDMRGTPAQFAGHPRTICAATPAPDAPPPAGYAGASKEEPSSNRQREPSENLVAFERMQALKSAYPKRSGREDWIIAERTCLRLVGAGAGWDELTAAAIRYATYCRATDTDPKHVLKPSTFFGAEDEPWRQEWQPPPTKAQRKQDKSVNAGIEWLRQQEASNASG